MKYHCYKCKVNIDEETRFTEASGKLFCNVCSVGATPCTDREKFIESIVGEDLKDVSYYFYNDNLFIKSSILSVDHRNLEVIFQNGSVVISKDVKITKIKKPSNVIKKFKWCYSLRDKYGELLGYLCK